MATEEELKQADGVIDVFGEAFMKLVRKRLRLQGYVYHQDRGKVQINIKLVDILSTEAVEIDSLNITLESDLNIRTGY
jgi:hypothetical protein